MVFPFFFASSELNLIASISVSRQPSHSHWVSYPPSCDDVNVNSVDTTMIFEITSSNANIFCYYHPKYPMVKNREKNALVFFPVIYVLMIVSLFCSYIWCCQSCADLTASLQPDPGEEPGWWWFLAFFGIPAQGLKIQLPDDDHGFPDRSQSLCSLADEDHNFPCVKVFTSSFFPLVFPFLLRIVTLVSLVAFRTILCILDYSLSLGFYAGNDLW